MVINLNKKMVDKQSLLKCINDLDIYNMYMDETVTLKGNIKSPLRNDDNNPSFGFFIGENAEIYFKDFKLGSGDCIKFVQMKFGLNYFEAMSKIVIDAELEDEFIIKNTFKTNVNTFPSTINREDLISEINSTKIGKKSRKWQLHDLSYWNQYGIDHKTLLKYNVEPISHIFVNGKIITADKYAYCFTEFKDGIETYKIYQPYNTSFKWLSSHNDSVWQGWEQLPETGETLIITKSLKDVMAISTICNLPSISLQAEGLLPKPHIIDQLQKRFENIFILYDNDYDKETNWGKEFSKRISDNFGLIKIEIDEELKSKDFSDLIKNHNKNIAQEYLLNKIELPF